MPPDERPQDKAFHWRREDAYVELTAAAFAKLVAENGIPTLGPFGGYYYAMNHTTEGEELYRTVNGKNVWWLYQSRHKFTNAAATGNPIIVDISMSAGVIAKLVSLFAATVSIGNHTISAQLLDEDRANDMQLSAGSASGTVEQFCLPSIGTTAIGAATCQAGYSPGLLIGPGQILRAAMGGASANAADTLEVGLVLLLSAPTVPTWSFALSTDAADITDGGDTISVANRLQAVVM